MSNHITFYLFDLILSIQSKPVVEHEDDILEPYAGPLASNPKIPTVFSSLQIRIPLFW